MFILVSKPKKKLNPNPNPVVIEQTFNISDGSFNLRLTKIKIFVYLNTLRSLQGQFVKN